MRRARRVMVFAVASLLLGASGATAGTYDVSLRLCSPEDTTPFEFVADSGLEAFADCQDGRVVTATGRGSTIPSGASAAATLTAPAETTFESIAIGGGYRRPDCRWDAGVAADGVIVIGARAFEGCDSVMDDRGGRASLDGAGTISLRVACRDPEGCPTPEGRPWPDASAAAHLREATLTIRDDVPPGVEIFGFDETGSGWVSGVRPLFYGAFDYTGLREISLTMADHHQRHVATCDYTRLVPCPESEEPLSVDTSRVPDGMHATTVEVVDSGGNRSSQTMSAFVDNTPPHRVQPDVDGGSGWQRINDFSVSWIATRERHAPITAVHYRLCRAGTTECVRGSESTDGVVGLNTIERLTELKVPEPGAWTIEVWREDEAGNVSEPSPAVPLRLDDAPPALAFEPRRLDDPRRVSVAVSDGVSGVAGGEIHLRAAGSGSWQPLPTRLDGGRLTAEVDDDRLPAGTYELRAQARDHAGNEARTHVLPSGEAALLQLPLRQRARLTAGIVRRSGKKKKSRLLGDAKAGFNAKVRLGGRLANGAGHPVRGAQLRVYWAPRVGRERSVGAVTTNRAGEFSSTLRARASGTVRIRYEGSRMVGSAQRELLLRVPAASVLRVNRRKVLNGGSVVFSGRLRGRPFPPLGKIIYLQAYLPDEGWSTFGEDRRTDANGRWRVRWEFENTRGLVRYRFRVLVPREADYPFEEGASNVVRVTVRGR